MIQRYLILAVLFISFSGLNAFSKIAIIPKPNLIQYKEGNFNYAKGLDIKIVRGNDATKQLQKQLISAVKEQKVAIIPFSPTTITLNLLQANTGNLPADGYTLSITPTAAAIASTGNAGLFYGIQSLMQLLYADSTKQLPCLEITDSPSFTYRGFHIDETHQFFGVTVIKKYLDAMAKLKLNQFHWQLTDAQKWRIKLNNNDALTDSAKAYTPDEIKSIVKYAQERFINIIPEIHIPTNTEQNSFSNNRSLIDEVCALFPGDYIQIGNSYPNDSIIAYWKQKNKKIIGNDRKGFQGETVVSYKNNKTGFSLAGKGTDVIMAQRQYCSLDYYQDWEDEKKSISMSFLPLSKSYSYHLLGKTKDTTILKHVLGGQAFLFTNFIKNEETLEYQTFPRLLALAECFWTNNKQKKFNDFEARLSALKNYFFIEKELPAIDLVRIKPKKEKEK